MGESTRQLRSASLWFFRDPNGRVYFKMLYIPVQILHPSMAADGRVLISIPLDHGNRHMLGPTDLDGRVDSPNNSFCHILLHKQIR